jgi:hypothetical protein
MNRLIGIILLVGVVAMPGVAVAVGDCTDGVDCYCDRVKNPSDPLYDPQLARCLDWEDPEYYSGDASRAPSGQPGFRGGAAWWQRDFGPADSDCSWLNGQPANPKLGQPCAYGACAAAIFSPTDAWDGNAKACVDVQRTGDIAAEIPGLSLSGGHSGNVWDGKTHMANRIRTDAPSALASAIAGPFRSEMGVTMARAYSTNLLAANPANDSNWVTQPWKGEQTDGGLQFPEGNTGPQGFNNPPFSGGTVNANITACQQALASAEILIGNMDCSSALRHAAARPGDCSGKSTCDASNEFNRKRDWPLGEWGCVRAYWSGHGTTNAEMWIEFQSASDPAPRRIFHVRNLNSAAIFGTGAQIGTYVWDAYYNANGGNSWNTPSTETFYRYNDNMHLRHGPPVSCAQIGFGATGGTPPPPPPPATPPEAPVLLPPS